jgi:NO-binding membrane sensor protein with MHYT domain
MSKLIALLQILASSGRWTVATSPWPQRLIRRLALALCLLTAGGVLLGTLIAIGLFWGYQAMIQQGMAPDDALLIVTGSVLLLLAITAGALAYIIRDIKGKIRPFLVQPVSLTTQVTQSVQDVFNSFARGYAQGQTTSRYH